LLYICLLTYKKIFMYYNMVDKYKYFCDKCKYGTNIKHSLLHHNKTILHITGERGKKQTKEKKEYKCDKCEYKSTNKNNHLTHVLNNHSTKEEKKSLNIIVIIVILEYLQNQHIKNIKYH